MEEMCDSAGSEARRFHEERGGKGEGGSGGGVFVRNPVEGRDLHATFLVVLRRLERGLFESVHLGMQVLCV